MKELEIKLEEEKKYEEVSRGQLQRIGLARALIKNAEVIILDEPTAGLDLELEEKILRIIKKYSEGKTVIIATHREKVIKQAEEVIDLEKIKN